MDSSVQIWAVDVSAYSLWTVWSKGEALIHAYLESTPEEEAKVKRYLREIDQIR